MDICSKMKKLLEHFMKKSCGRPVKGAFVSLTIIKRAASSAKSFTLVFSSLGKSLIQMRKKRNPEVEPWGTPVRTDQISPFKTAL